MTTYARVAEVLTGLGMVTADKAEAVLADAPAEPLDSHEVAGVLECFGVAVLIHAEDVDFADEHYGWLLNEAATVSGATVSAYRFERGTMHFECDGRPLAIVVEQESNDYLDMSAAREAIEALSPDFHRVTRARDHFGDDVMVFATAEQRAGLGQHLGLRFD